MKQLEHTYIDNTSLESFIRSTFPKEKFSVQIFARNSDTLMQIKGELDEIASNSAIMMHTSPSQEQPLLMFTLLPMDAVEVEDSRPSEFDFFQTGPVIIFRREPKDDCWVVTHVTQSVSQWGYDAEYFVDNEEAVKEVFHKDDMEHVRQTLLQHVEAGVNTVNQQYRIYKADGSIAWVSDYTQVVRNLEGEPIELIGYLVDVTADKEHEALYAGIINTTTEGFWLLDTELQITDVNYSLCAMLGYTKDEMIGKEPYDFIDSSDHLLCQEQADSIDAISSRIYEIVLKTKKGEKIYTIANATTMYDQGENVRTFAFMTDITKQKKIEEDLRSRQEAIEELNDSLESKIMQEVEKNREKDQMMYQQSRLASMGEMIGNIAHQWRQPLNIMALVMQDIYISDQLGNLTSTKVEESYEKSNNLLQYMSQTIDDFRNFFKQDTEEHEFSVKDTIDSVYSLVSTNLAYNHIECVIDVRHDSIIKGGMNEFKQVLINILNNAQEAIQINQSKRKLIEVIVTQENEQAKICISDDGGGMSEDVINKVFDPYFTTKNKTQGTGLGLYMSKQIIENSMCGILQAKNVGDGAEFCIMLPIKQ